MTQRTTIPSEFRDIAELYHGGHWSPLYACCRSGEIETERLIELCNELNDCMPMAGGNELITLHRFCEWAEQTAAAENATFTL